MERSSRAELSTTAGLPRAPRRPGVVARLVATGLLTVFVALGAAGFFGERTTSVTSTDDAGRTLTVTYAAVARGGLDVPWRIELTDPAGLPAQVELAIDSTYFEIYESQRFFPEPAEESRDARSWHVVFDTGGATELVVEYDAYLQPRFLGGRKGSVAVVDPDSPALAVEFRTTLMP